MTHFAQPLLCPAVGAQEGFSMRTRLVTLPRTLVPPTTHTSPERPSTLTLPTR